jgi:hypothetical protein
LDRENVDTLYAYAAFIEEDADYVVNQLVETVLGKDRAFVTWRAQHPQPFVPPRSSRRRGRPRHRTDVAPRSGSAPHVDGPAAAASHH